MEELEPAPETSPTMNQQLRRRILALTETEHRRLTFDRSGAAQVLNDPFTTVLMIPLSEDQRQFSQLRELEDSGALVPGAVLVQNVFNRNRYVPINDVWHQFARAKYTAVVQVCQLLGAYYVDVKDIKTDTDGTFVRTKARLGGTNLKANTDFRKEVFDKFKLTIDFDGGHARPDEAWSYITSRGLHQDMTLQQLLELRRDDHNKLRTHLMEIELLAEAQTQFAFGLSLAEMLKAASPAGLDFVASGAKMHFAQVKIDVGFVPRRDR
jgi:hypothetical protein